MIPEPYYINLRGGLQAVHRFFLGNEGKNVSRETWQLTIDNLPGKGTVSLGRPGEIKQCGPPEADRGVSLLWNVYTEVYRDRQEICGGQGRGLHEDRHHQPRPLSVSHLWTLNGNTCNKAAGILRGGGASPLK